MASVSLVGLSELKGAKRIDADRYSPWCLALEKRIESLKDCVQLKSLLKVPVRTGRTPRDRVLKEGDTRVCFVKTDVLREGYINFANTDGLPATSVSSKDFLRDNDVIVTIIGADLSIIGRASIYYDIYPQAVVNQNVAVIRVDEKKISPHYLMVLLNSEFGRKQLWMLSRQTEQVNLNCREVEDLRVPLFDSHFQRGIEELAAYSAEMHREAKRLYSKAEALLLEGVGLKSLVLECQRTYSADLLACFKVGRLDAEFFQPAYNEVVEHLRGLRHVYIKDIKMVNRRGIQPVYVSEGDVRVVTSKNLGTTSIDYEGLVRTTRDEWTRAVNARIRRRDILTYTTGANVGRTNCFMAEFDALASNHVNILRVKELSPIVVSVFLNSIAGQIQVSKFISGSAQAELYPSAISEFVVWEASEEIEEQLEAFVIESHVAARKGIEAFKEARKRISEAVES